MNDTFAVRVMHKEKKVGYLPKPCSAVIAKRLDEGNVVTGLVDGIDDATVDVQLAIVA